MFLTLFSFLTRVLHMILGVNTPQNFPPPLSPEEERACFLRAESGDEDARQTLILHNLRLVSHIVRKYYSSAQDPEDLVSIGTIGLIKAVDSFNIRNGARFATYGAKCVQNEILMYFRSRNHSCIVGFMLGGQAGNGYNMYKAYEYLTSVETRRPVIYEAAEGEWNSDPIE